MDPMPKTWWLESSVPDIEDCILIPKTDLHLYNGDSGEVALHERSSEELKKLKNHHANVRFRIKYHDAPEIDTTIRLYRQKEDSNRKQTITTCSIGIQSLRAARKLIFNAKDVYFYVTDNENDMYHRLLVDIWLMGHDDEFTNFAERLAENGYTYPLTKSVVHLGINAAMSKAKEAHRGMFSLPDEVFESPFRPWEV